MPFPFGIFHENRVQMLVHLITLAIGMARFARLQFFLMRWIQLAEQVLWRQTANTLVMIPRLLAGRTTMQIHWFPDSAYSLEPSFTTISKKNFLFAIYVLIKI